MTFDISKELEPGRDVGRFVHSKSGSFFDELENLLSRIIVKFICVKMIFKLNIF